MKAQLSVELLLSFAAFLAMLFLLSGSLYKSGVGMSRSQSLLSAHSKAMEYSAAASSLWLFCAHCSHDALFPNSTASAGEILYQGAAARTIAQIEGGGRKYVRTSGLEPS